MLAVRQAVASKMPRSVQVDGCGCSQYPPASSRLLPTTSCHLCRYHSRTTTAVLSIWGFLLFRSVQPPLSLFPGAASSVFARFHCNCCAVSRWCPFTPCKSSASNPAASSPARTRRASDLPPRSCLFIPHNCRFAPDTCTLSRSLQSLTLVRATSLVGGLACPHRLLTA
jgi:hypothetical protein